MLAKRVMNTKRNAFSIITCKSKSNEKEGVATRNGWVFFFRASKTDESAELIFQLGFTNMPSEGPSFNSLRKADLKSRKQFL